MPENAVTRTEMTEDERLDICEAIYGKLTRAYKSFFWDSDKKRFVDVRTGDDLLSFLDYSQVHNRYRYLTQQHLKVMKKAVAIKRNDGIITMYSGNCEPCVRLERDIPSSYIKEYIANTDKLAIYLIDRKTIAKGMVVAVVDYTSGELKSYYDNVTRIFESNEALKLVLLEDGKLVSVRFEL